MSPSSKRPVPTPTRRTVVAAASAVSLAPVLAACGDSDDDSGKKASASPGTVVARTSDIPVGGGKIFGKEGVVVTQPMEGEFKAFTNICTHRGCPVASVKDGAINCNCHGSQFSIEDGSVKSPPATKPLAEKKIEVTGDDIKLA